HRPGGRRGGAGRAAPPRRRRRAPAHRRSPRGCRRAAPSARRRRRSGQEGKGCSSWKPSVTFRLCAVRRLPAPRSAEPSQNRKRGAPCLLVRCAPHTRRKEDPVGLSDLMDAASQAPVKRRRRRSRWLVPFFLAVAVLVATVELVTHKTVLPVPEQCQADTSSGLVQLSLVQMKNASTIAARAVVKGLPVRAATVAIATAMQESQLVNLDTGDRDSIGLFQQRPSQGWG